MRVAAVVATALVFVAGVGGVIAWLTASNQVENAFTLGTVVPDLSESGPDGGPFEDGDNIKQNVNVTNNGNIPIYVRAQVSIYWLDANGNQMWEEPYMGEKDPGQPTGVIIPPGDYMMTWGSSVMDAADLGAFDGTCWVKGADGFYYWTMPLNPKTEDGTLEPTENLIERCEYYGEYSDGRRFVCDISIQGIQAEPARAVEEAWGVTVDSNTGAITALPGDGQNAGGSTTDSNNQAGA